MARKSGSGRHQMKKATPNKRVELKLQRLKKLIKLKLDLQTLKRLEAECGPEEEIEAIKERIREGILGESKELQSHRALEKKQIRCPYWCPSFGERCPYRCPTAIPLYITKSHLMN
jgi:hypothetical protein